MGSQPPLVVPPVSSVIFQPPPPLPPPLVYVQINLQAPGPGPQADSIPPTGTIVKSTHFPDGSFLHTYSSGIMMYGDGFGYQIQIPVHDHVYREYEVSLDPTPRIQEMPDEILSDMADFTVLGTQQGVVNQSTSAQSDNVTAKDKVMKKQSPLAGTAKIKSKKDASFTSSSKHNSSTATNKVMKPAQKGCKWCKRAGHRSRACPLIQPTGLGNMA